MEIANRTYVIDHKQLYALKHEPGGTTNNGVGVTKAAEESYSKLYSNNDWLMNIKVSYGNMSEIRIPLKLMKRLNAEAKHILSIDMFKDTRNFLLDNLTLLFTKFLQNCSIPRTHKNAIMILIYKKEDHT